jgi:indolepyruvate ferredoxin oxidoreductase beta subunit
MGDAPYPEDIISVLKKNFKLVKEIDATDLAKKAGNVKAANVVLLGAVSGYLDIKQPVWESVIEKSFPEKLVKVNLASFQMGRSA